MKKTLLLLAITFTFSQQIQAQTTQDLLQVGTSLFGGSKKQKKKDRENFVIDSTNNAVDNKKKRELLVKDSLLNIESVNRQKELIKTKELAEKTKLEWNYDITPSSFTFNKIIVGYFVEGNIDSPRIAMEIFSDLTTTTKIGSVKLSETLPTEVFDILAYNSYHASYLIKSEKDNKICVIHEDVISYRNYGKGKGARLTNDYISPQVIAQKKLLLDSYRLKLNGALSTVSKLEAIHSKHIYKKVNQFGVVIAEGYNTDKFTKQEKITYKQLIMKLDKQKDSLDADLAKKIGDKETVRGLLEVSDVSKQLQVEHAHTDYSYYALNW